MKEQIADQSPETVVQRIDAIIRELEELRRLVLREPGEPSDESRIEQLYGALGQGDWSEYDPDLDWQRFGV